VIDALFLDVDGVLIDSVGVKGDAFVDAFAGYPDRREAVLTFHRENGGLPRGKKIQRIMEEIYGQDAAQAEIKRVTSLFADSVVERVLQSPEIAGATSALEVLGQAIPLHAVSATPTAELIDILAQRGWAAHFSSVHGVPPEKSETVRDLLRAHCYRPDHCYLIGDSTHDHHAALANGVPFIYVSTDLSDRIPDAAAVVPDLVSLPHLLLRDPKMDP
jgi:phosphoglycolate phosphatase-like HAD superfamily hydrolase